MKQYRSKSRLEWETRCKNDESKYLAQVNRINSHIFYFSLSFVFIVYTQVQNFNDVKNKQKKWEKQNREKIEWSMKQYLLFG